MAYSKIPLATTIPLSPLGTDEYYAVIIQEERDKKKWNAMWLFRKGCSVAHYCFGKIASQDDPSMTVDGIRALDMKGEFDVNKELLSETSH